MRGVVFMMRLQDDGKTTQLVSVGRDVPAVKWWGDVKLALGETLQKTLGEVGFYVQRQEREWLISRWMETDLCVDRKSTREKNAAKREDVRFVISSADTTLSLSPALADRSVVSRPVVPVTLLPRASGDFYVSTPLWISITSGTRKIKLMDFPTIRPSDTWFGPNTRMGELCYMSRTDAFASLDCLPVQADRVITPVRIINESNESLNVSHIKLAVPHLSVFSDTKMRLWTERAVLVNKGDTSLFEFRVDKTQHLTDACERLSEPRVPLRRNRLTQTWSFLIGSS
ncbi:MAG: hypothetical protein P8176_07000 [Gammaproteobacteria bacterium]